MEHIIFHWDDITDLLIDDLLEEEAQERNNIEYRVAQHDRHGYPSASSTYKSKYHSDLELPPKKSKHEIDMRDIMKVFEDYR